MENTNEFFKFLRERLKYPIISVYVIILIIYNWDVLSILFFSDLPIEGRVIYIKNSYPDSNFERVWIPLLKAFIAMIAGAIAMFIIDAMIYFPNTGRTWFKDRRTSQKLKNDVKNARFEHQIKEEKEGNKSIEEWQLKLEQKDKSIEELKKSYQQRIYILEDSTKQMQITIERQKKDYDLQSRELNNARLQSNENAGDLLNTMNFIDAFIQPILEKFRIGPDNILLILSKIVKNPNITGIALRTELRKNVKMNDIKFLDLLRELRDRGLIMINNQAGNLSITTKGTALYSAMGPIIDDNHHRLNNFREPGSSAEDGLEIEDEDK